MPPRDWGWWTEQKLDILSDYLTGFSKACSRAGKTVYLDLFAGQAENVSRERSRHTINGSPRRALDVRPPLSVLRFFELPSNADRLDQTLRADYPGRDFRVVPGDCNDKIGTVLSELSDLTWAPTFAFLDQQSTEVRWSTLERLARHKKKGTWKTELWMLCASGLLPRGLKIRQDIDGQFIERINAMYGTNLWLDALEATRDGILTSDQFRAELTNLMRWRMEKHLGYQKTRVFSVKNTAGTPIFDMIFATDHEVGDKIMKWVYDSAVSRQPALQLQARLLRRETRNEESGVYGMFDIEQFTEMPKGDVVRIEPSDVPTHPPYRHS